VKRPLAFMPIPLLMLLTACGGSSRGPMSPSASVSFLAGTWRGTVTIEVNPGDPSAVPPTSGTTQWTFETVPDSNQQAFRTTMQSDHAWLRVTTSATTALTPTGTPPAQISTHGQFDSPRGCRGTFGSVGTASVSRIEADFTGTDCQQATFIGRIVLTKQ
jgi:hypothetical protein